MNPRSLAIVLIGALSLLGVIGILWFSQSKGSDPSADSDDSKSSASLAQRLATRKNAGNRKRAALPGQEPIAVLRKKTKTLLKAPSKRDQASPFLTAPSPGDALDIALDYIRSPRPAAAYTEDDFKDPKVSNRYTSKHNGVTHIYLRQRHNGIEVYNGYLNTNVLPDGRIANLHNDFIPDLASEIEQTEPIITAAQAISEAAAYYNLPSEGSFEPLPVKDPDVAARKQLFTPAGISTSPIPVKLNYVALERGKTRLAWNMSIQFNDKVRWLDLNVDAETGELLSEVNWVSHAGYNVYPFPLETPNDGARSIETDPHNTSASPFGWHDTNGVPGAEFSDTRGNNVNAQEDADDNNTGGVRPSGGSGLNFNFSADLTQAPASYQPAVTTNLFYWNNIIHDILWHYGFDEPAGNFQENNYGNGGQGSDPVEADSQDGSGTNNANFGTPPDGSNPRMQMYIWTGPNPDRDSSFDNGIIIHEYGHGVSNRLTGGPANASALSANQSRGMGEGWSDFLGLAFTHQSGDTATTGRGIGTYVLGQPTTGAGIRPYRYTTNMGANPQTFGDLAGGELSVPHGIGSVWCTTLWEVYWALVAAHGYDSDLFNGTGGNNIAIQLVLDGMKLQPVTPTYTEARDAIILADQVNNAGANFDLLWAAFAKRGLGASAYDGGSANSLSVVESFDIPDDLEVSPPSQETFRPGGRPGGPFSPSGRAYTLENTGTGNLNWTVSANVNWLDLSTVSGSLAASATTTVLATLNGNANSLPGGLYPARVSFVNTTSGATIIRQVELSVNDLGEAVDEPSLTFTTANPGWFTQNSVTLDGVDAAQAGSITHNQNSAMELTVTGPDNLRFFWKVNSETNFDFLRFYDNGGIISAISGNVDWTEVVYSIPSGSHTLRWEYAKDGSVDTGADTGWVDNLYLASVHPEPAILSDLTANGNVGAPFQYQIVATQNPTSYSSGVLPSGLSFNASTGLISGTPNSAGIYPVSITATNGFGSDTETLTIRISGTASYPFTETFESGTLNTAWTVGGTGPFRTQVTQSNGPQDLWHLTMDSSTNSTYARNELTLAIDLAGQSNVSLQFDAKDFSDEQHGPPTAPFIGGADFDGVAISEDGSNWYEVQPLRDEISSTYTHFTIYLDTALATHGLSYNSAFFIRFNQYDNFGIATDGIAFDNITVSPADPDISVEYPVGTDLVSGSALVSFGDTGTGQQSTRNFTIRNVGDQSLTGLSASFVGAAAANYSAAGFGSTTLAPGQATTVDITLTPSALGTRAATLRIASNDPDENPFEIDLTGNGVVPPLVTAAFPFEETFETGMLAGYWTVGGTGRNRTLLTQANGPYEGSWHLTMDSSIIGTSSRNELTLAIDLAAQPSAVLRFRAKSFGENPDGPPPVPFVDGANFDGVAISTDGTNWYEVQPLRTEISSEYDQFTVDLAAAAATHGLTFNAAFRIRFNHFDNSPIPVEGFAFDNIQVLSLQPEITIEQPSGTILTDGVSTVNFGTVETNGQQSSRSFVISNHGTQTLTGLFASINGATTEYGAPPINPTSLAPGESTTYTLFFDPAQLGTRAATLSITSNDVDESPFDINLTGEGVPIIAAPFPLTEGFESGSLEPFWKITGTGAHRTEITQANSPHTGSSHLTMDASAATNSRNELTLTIDLLGQSGVTLKFWAKEFSDESHGPPSSPFVNGADFDGVAISEDGVLWYEVQALRSEISSVYSEYRVNLDHVTSIRGLSYNSGFRIRFNHYDNGQIAADGFAFDDIVVESEVPDIGVEQPAGTNLSDGIDVIDFGEIATGSDTTLNFTVRNTGAAPLTGLAASFSGASAADYSAGPFGTTSLLPGLSTNLNVTFAPSVTGQRLANLHIASNDSDENPFDLVLNGRGGNAEIGVEQPAGTDLSDGVSSVDFGSANPGQTIQRTFTIRNHGSSNLTQLSASIAGTHLLDYTVGALGTTTLTPGQSTTLNVSFSPNGGASRTAVLRIASNDQDENPFDIDLTGNGLDPEIVVEQPLGTGLVSGSSQVSFGSFNPGQSGNLTFTVRNAGTVDLSGLAVSFVGLNPGEFSSTAPGATTLSAGASTTFTVTFTPQQYGDRSATLRLASNDRDENPFEVLVEGVGVAPEIAVDLLPDGGGSVELTDGADTVDFGTTSVGDTDSQVIRIRNIGTSTLSGLATSFSGAAPGDYGAGAFGSASLEPGESTTVTINFAPTTGNIRLASLQIASNDSDENPFDINLTGNAQNPEIGLEQPALTDLIDGSSSVDFGSIQEGLSDSRTFTVRNHGDTNLTGLAGSVDGAESGDFSVGPFSSTNLAPGQSATFSISFTPTGGGPRNATLHVASNDFDENPFDVNLNGIGLGPEIGVEEPVGTGLQNGLDLRDFGSVDIGEDGDLTFTVHNTGTVNLSGLGVSFAGLNPGEFSATPPGATTLSPGGSTTFTVTFSPQESGDRSAVLQIASNDSDETPFLVSLHGVGVGPEIELELLSGAGDSNSILYGHNSSSLYTVDPATGASTLVGTSGVQITGLAYDPSRDTLFGINASADTLVSVDRNTGALTTIGSLGYNSTSAGLAYDPANDRLYSGSGSLYSINPANGAGSLIGIVTTNMTAYAYDPNANILYGLHSSDPEKLLQINTSTAQTTLIGETGIASALEGLAYDQVNDILYMNDFGGDVLYTLNVNTGVPTAVGPSASNMQGLAFVPGTSSGTPLTDASDTVDFGNLSVGATIDQTFRVTNSGNSSLTGLAAAFTGPAAADYSAGDFGSVTLAPGETTTVTVTFTPTAGGVRPADLQIASNDSNENPFDITLTGVGQTPDISVEQPVGTVLTDAGSSVNFDEVALGDTGNRIFTVRNDGNEPLSGLAASFSGADAAQFSAGSFGSTTLGIGQSTTFTVNFSPSSIGPQTSTLLIASNDIDENPFDITLNGSGINPEIVVEEPVNVDLTDGNAIIDFGDVLHTDSTDRTITIRNAGTTALTGLATSISGAQAGDYSAGSISPNILQPGESTTVMISFTGSATGIRNATLQIVSNDADENPFDIDLTAESVGPTTLDDFADLYNLTGDDRLPDADTDGDSATLLEEYAYGLNPTLRDARVMAEGGDTGLPLIRLVNDRLQIEFVRRRNDASLSYIPECSSDLPNGFAQGAGPETVTIINGRFERVIVQDDVGLPEFDQRFARVRLALSPPL